MTYKELQTAMALLGLPERATLAQIKSRYRTMVKETHPDTGIGGSAEAFRRLHDAYRTVIEYAAAYKISFSEDDFYEQNPEERLRKQFEHDPIWG